MKRRNFLSTMGLGATGVLFGGLGQACSVAGSRATTSSFAQLSRQHNVLLIMSDDLNNDLGAYGNDLVHTPNIDRLAANGVTFANAQCQFPLCNPSRASMMTGLRPDTTQVYDLSTHFRDIVPDVTTLPQLFKNNGYTSVRLGKIYHYNVPRQIGTDGLDDPVSWDRAINQRGVDLEEEDSMVSISPRGHVLGYYESPSADEEHTDGIMATQAIDVIEELKVSGEPFFLGVGFFRPHYPSIAPKKYFDLYPLEEMTLAPQIEGDLDDIPEAALFQNPPFDLTDEEQKLARRGYYAAVSFMDAQVGRLLDTMDRLELTENTIIVFVSDHGYNLGEHQQWIKQMMFEPTAEAPLIISVPGGLQNVISNRIVEYLDIYPTLAELAGLDVPDHLQGVSLVPLLNDPDAAWDRPGYSQIQRFGRETEPMGRSVRTERWRYNEWEDGDLGIELYDHQNDPNEWTNLVNNSEYAGVISELRGLLHSSYTN